MTSSIRNGFSTLNRLMKKKDKKSASMSKATSCTSIANLDSSNMYNKVVPLAASTNAPFEQTFRIKIFLPRDQLYVVRVGAKTRLETLLKNVCLDKQLDMRRYEFQHPANCSQVFDNNLTVGEVGFNEIRLAPKNHFNSNSNSMNVVELRQNGTGNYGDITNLNKNVSHYTKSKSMYGSIVSINSIDSSSLGSMHMPVAPIRKKRIAPRPPSTIIISQQQTGDDAQTPFNSMSRNKLYMSSPNLTQNPNTKEENLKEFNNNFLTLDAHNCTIESSTELTDTGQNSTLNSIPNNRSSSNEENEIIYSNRIDIQKHATNGIKHIGNDLPEPPVPRKRGTLAKKKAPAPPPAIMIERLPPSAPPRTLPKPKLKTPDYTSMILDSDGNDVGDEKDHNFNVHSEEEHVKLLSSPEDNIVEQQNHLHQDIKSDELDDKVDVTITSSNQRTAQIDSTERISVNEEIAENLKNESREVINQNQIDTVNGRDTDFNDDVVDKVSENAVVASEMIEVVELNVVPENTTIPIESIESDINGNGGDTMPEKEYIISSDVEDGYYGNVTKIIKQNSYEKISDKIDIISECGQAAVTDTATNTNKSIDNSIISIDDSLSELTITNHKEDSRVSANYEDGAEEKHGSIRDFKYPLSSSKLNDQYKKYRRVNRSDSFHSTYITNVEKSKLYLRSASYVSLLGKYHDENQTDINEKTIRRKSTSEIVGTMPSLQSLLVMKSILNNSLKNVASMQHTIETEPAEPITAPIVCESTHITKTNLILSSPQQYEVEIRHKNAQNIEEETQEAPHNNHSGHGSNNDNQSQNETKEFKRWTYQGPPSINLSTWRERPKSKVIIKSDSDYIFGGGKGKEQHKEYSSADSSKRTIKSLNNTTVNVNGFRAEELTRQTEIVADQQSHTNVLLREHNVTPEPDNYSSMTMPLYSVMEKRISRTGFAIQPFQKRHSNRFSDIQSLNITKSIDNEMNRVEFQSTDRKENIPLDTNVERPAAPKPQTQQQLTSKSLQQNSANILLSQTIGCKTDFKHNPEYQTINNERSATRHSNGKVTEKNEHFLYQVTLRKTGFKEKILAEPNQKTVTTINSTIQRPTAQIEINNSKLKCQANDNNNKATEEVRRSRFTPIIRSVTTKNNLTIPVGPRDQLLDSIRSFNRDNLKKNAIY